MWPLCKRLEVSPGFCLLAAWFALSSGWQALAVILLAAAVLLSGLVACREAPEGERQIELRLLPEGMTLYQEGHRRIQMLAGRLISEMGEEKIRVLLPLLRQAADSFDAMQQEVK